MIQIKDKANCCGCSSCANACPKKCISMQPDNEGFLYPVIDNNKCVDCGICEKVCPIINVKKPIPFEQKAYIIQHKDSRILKESTSGGAFTAIAEYVIDRGGVVFGAAFDDDFKVVHTYVETKKELAKFRNSKYVQSDIADSYKKVKCFLNDERLVCFSGTPCQIEGLRSFLGRDYENLILVDLVCHAVPSPLVWEKYKKVIAQNSKINNMAFRDKEPYGYQYSQMSVAYSDKKIFKGVESDYFLKAFFSDLSDRPSCYNCQFKERYRKSDFTIWDCWEADRFDTSFDNKKGTTCVLIHSSKGQTIAKKAFCGHKVCEISSDELCKGVREMFNSISINPKRNQFFNDINKMDEKDFFNKYFPMTFKVRFERMVRIVLNYLGIDGFVKKVLRKVRRINEK